MNTTGRTTVHAGDVITMKGKAFYVKDANNGSLKMLDLSTLTEYTGRAGSNPDIREATPEEKHRAERKIIADLEESMAFSPGVLVLFRNPTRPNEQGIHVVTANNEKTVTLFPLGGSKSGQYVRAPRNLLTVIDPADVLK